MGLAHCVKAGDQLGLGHTLTPCVLRVLPQDGEFTQVHLTMNTNAPAEFSDNDCVLLSSRHPEV